MAKQIKKKPDKKRPAKVLNFPLVNGQARPVFISGVIVHPPKV